MHKLIILRHGQTKLNKRGIVQGTSDFPLNQHGIQQAELVADKIKQFNVSHIFSSDQKRAKQTADIISATCGCDVTTYSALREQNYGAAEGKPVIEMRRMYPEHFSVMDDISHEHTNTTSFPGGETRQAVFNRVSRQLQKSLAKTPHETLGIVTHGGVILSLMAVQFGRMTHVKNGDYLIIYYDGRHFKP